MIDSRRVCKSIALTFLTLATLSTAQQSEPHSRPASDRYHALPEAWAGDWDTVEKLDSSLPKNLKIDPPFQQADPMIKADLTPAATARMNATDYDTAPGSLCDPEGWFPFINYGYGFALLASPGKITFVPVEPDTEGIRRAYLQPQHSAPLTPTWDGDSIASWEGETLVIDTVGFNDKSWLGDDRERHSTELHMTERMRLLAGGRYLEVQYEMTDPPALKSPYHLTRYFEKFMAVHIGAGPDRNMAELVCNEDPSPFKQDKKAAAPASSAR